jgi:hypothetical protein
VGASLQRGWGGLNAERREPTDLVQRCRIVEQQVLSGVAEEPNRLVGVDGDSVSTGNAVVVHDLVRVAVVARVIKEQAYPGETLQPIDSVAV